MRREIPYNEAISASNANLGDVKRLDEKLLSACAGLTKREGVPIDPAVAFRRFEELMRKLVRVPKKEVDGKIATERRGKQRRKPA